MGVKKAKIKESKSIAFLCYQLWELAGIEKAYKFEICIAFHLGVETVRESDNLEDKAKCQFDEAKNSALLTGF